MRVVIQRVTRAAVRVDGAVVGAIDAGLCLLVGVTDGDTEATVAAVADKVTKLRIFADDEGKMNRSVLDVGGSILVVSQFTLYADVSRGNRPSFVAAGRPELAEPLIELLAGALAAILAAAPVAGVAPGRVATGQFGAAMALELVNDGPVTIILDL